jgi:Gene 25-like lysozyme.
MSGFKIPFELSNNAVYENNYLKNQDRAISDFITLMVNSPNGSLKSDLQFGFSLKNFRFENSDSNDRINRKKIEGKSVNPNNYAVDLKNALLKYEPRLLEPEVKIEFNHKESEVLLFITGLLKEGRKYEQKIKFHIW